MKTATLTNGIRTVIEKVPFFHSVSAGIWVKAGSRYETPEENGISHFIEHMLFKGTATKDARCIAATIDNIGGTLNAFTAKECTCFYVHVADEHLDTGLELLADMLKNSTLDPYELKKEQGVVLEEISMVEDTPDDLVHELAASGYYGSASLGQTILGPRERVSSFCRDDLRRYMAKRYVTGNIVLSVAGNLDEEKTLDMLEKYFASGIPVAQESPDIPAETGENTKKCVFCEKNNEQMNMCLTYGGPGSLDADFYPLTVFNAAFGGSMSSRLFQTVREQNGLTYSIFSYASTYNDCGTYSVYAGMNPEQTKRVLELVNKEIQLALTSPVSGEELLNAREQIKGSLILGSEGARPVMSRNGKLLLLRGRTETVEEVIDRVNGVTAPAVEQAVRNVFSSRRCCAFVGKSEYFPDETAL